MGDIKAGDDIFFTVSMAEVLEGQGHYEDALVIYKILSDSNPGEASLGASMDRLKNLAGRSKRQGPKKTAQGNG